MIRAGDARHVELRHLEYFVAVAEELAFTGASRRLHVVQSGVSSAIQGLERELGAALFDRDRHRVSLTEAGQALLAHFGCSAVVITRGEKGLSIFDESVRRHVTIPATSFEVTYARVGQPGVERGATGRQVFDVTGAGDTVLSVLSLAISAGASLVDAAVLANSAAGVVVGKLGTASVTVGELAAATDDLGRSLG